MCLFSVVPIQNTTKDTGNYFFKRVFAMFYWGLLFKLPAAFTHANGIHSECMASADYIRVVVEHQCHLLLCTNLSFPLPDIFQSICWATMDFSYIGRNAKMLAHIIQCQFIVDGDNDYAIKAPC